MLTKACPPFLPQITQGIQMELRRLRRRNSLLTILLKIQCCCTVSKKHVLNLGITAITMLRKCTITILFLLIGFCSLAQVPSPLIFSRITKKEGLASNTAFQTVRDKQGFLWIATQNGLQRYDGNRFLTFRHIPGDSSSIAENTVNHIFIDSKERLWLLFDKQTGIFNTASFKFTAVNVPASINMIKKIMEDGQGQLMLFADGKQLLYQEKKQSFDAAYPLPAIPQGYTIGDMAVDRSAGSCWFTGKQGSLLYDPKTKQFSSTAQHNISNPLLDSFCAVKNARYPFVAKDGTLWMVNWIPFTAAPPVLYSYDKKKNQLQKFEKIRAYKADSYYEIWGVFQQSNGTTWIYGMGLLAYYSPGENRFIHINSDRFQPNGIEYDMANDLYEDKEKNVWVSTNKGVYRFNVEVQVFQNIPNRRLNDSAVIHNAVSAIVQTKNDGIWVSTWGAGIFSYNNQLQPIANPVTNADPLNKSLHASYMIQRRNGEIWIGTQPGDIKIYDPAAGKCFTVQQPALRGQTITQLLEDHNGNTWIGTTTGLLVKCENGNWRDTGHAFKIILSDVTDIMKLYEDKKNHLWVCTAMDGVYEIDPATGKVFKQFKEGPDKNTGLLNDGATDILQYNDSIYLIASDGLCVLNSRTNTFRYLNTAYELPAEHITTLLTDKQKRLWVALDGGLYRLNSLDTKLYVRYEIEDGIVNNIFQVSAAALLDDGRIILGTPNDFMVFDPEKAIDHDEAPTVTITGFSVGEQSLNVDSLQRLQQVILRYDNTFTRIELSTLHFRDSYSALYMLEGLDNTWKPAENNAITFQYLPPGDYILKLKSQNGEADDKKITTLHIHVNAPFWKTWWFFSFLLLCLGGLLFWFDHRRMKRKEAIQKIRSNIADNLHKDISTTLDNISVLSEMAKMKAGSEPEKSKEFIEQIHTKSQNMTLAMDDILWSIDPGNDNMQNFMLRLNEYIDSLRNRYNTQIDVLVDKKVEGLQLKMETRKDIFWLFKSGITNVVKTGGANSRIHITYEKQHLVYTLEFDTANMNMVQINNLRQRKELSDKLAALHADLDFTEHTTNALFVLRIPVKAI